MEVQSTYSERGHQAFESTSSAFSFIPWPVMKAGSNTVAAVGIRGQVSCAREQYLRGNSRQEDSTRAAATRTSTCEETRDKETPPVQQPLERVLVYLRGRSRQEDSTPAAIASPYTHPFESSSIALQTGTSSYSNAKKREHTRYREFYFPL
jgi:hypothetical protein